MTQYLSINKAVDGVEFDVLVNGTPTFTDLQSADVFEYRLVSPNTYSILQAHLDYATQLSGWIVQVDGANIRGVTNVRGSDKDGVTIPGVVVAKASESDVDYSGVVDAADVTRLVDVIQGRQTSLVGDVYKDGVKNIRDVVWLAGVVNGRLRDPVDSYVESLVTNLGRVATSSRARGKGNKLASTPAGVASSLFRTRGKGRLASTSPHGAGSTNFHISGGGGGGAKTVLTQSDLTYLGYYYDGINVGDTGYAEGGFTHRYVGGQLRLLSWSWGGSNSVILVETSLPGSFGGSTTVTNQWNDAWGGAFSLSEGRHVGMWWEEAKSRLWTCTAIDYPNTNKFNETLGFHVRTLNSNGTISNLRGPYGLANISNRRYYGGAQAIPAWFRSQYGITHPYCIGWGGYASLQVEGGTVSLGPTMFAIPEPTDYANNTNFSSSQFKTIMDCSGAFDYWPNDWYSQGQPTIYDRGIRESNVTNDPSFDGGYWTSPAPDGDGRWVWGDTNHGTGCWIDGDTKHGFLTIPTMRTGRAWYACAPG